MKHDSFMICNVGETGMSSRIEFDNFRTRVTFSFDPDRVEYLGRVDLDSLDKIFF